MPTAIKVQNLTKSFVVPHEQRNTIREVIASGLRRREKSLFHALSEVSFEVNSGEVLGIIGRNGSGKSTLLKILAGIFPPSSGTVEVRGRISPFLELGVGFNPELSARDNVYLNATVLGLSREEIDAVFDEIIDFADLEAFVNQKLKNFSSGMQVRLAFSVAIKAKADIFLMDEVLAVGDMAFQQKCFDVFRRFKQEGKTIVLVSHDLSSIRQFCDRCLYLRHGQIVRFGTTDEVLDHYIYEDRAPEAKPKESVEQTPDVSDQTSECNAVEIVQARVLDKTDKPTTQFRVGDEIILEVDYQVKEPVKDLVIGIALKRSDGLHLFGDATSFHDLWGWEDGASVRVALKHPSLSSGDYQVTVAISDKAVQQIYDWRDALAGFSIVNTTPQDGFVHFDVEWMQS